MFVAAASAGQQTEEQADGQTDALDPGSELDVGAQVASVSAAVDRLAGFDARLVTAAQAMTLVAQLERVERQVCGLKVRLAGRVADTQTWRHRGDRSAAHWLARESGTSVSEAQSMLAVAGRLDDLPATADAIRRGRLSKAQAAAVVDAASVAPEAEGELLRAADRESLCGLRDRAARAKQGHDDEEARQAAVHATRRVRFGTDPDGAATMGVRTTNSAMAEIKVALAHHQNQVFEQARRDGLRDGFEAYAADALLAMARASLGVSAPVEGGPARRVSRVGTKVIVRIDHAALVRGRVAPGEVCDVPGTGPLPVSAVQQLLGSGEAFATAVATTHGPSGEQVAVVAHLGRGPVTQPDLFTQALAHGREVVTARASRRPDAYQVTALDWTTPLCTVEGCNAPRQEIDHRRDWAETHHTKLDELEGYCTHHHALKTRQNFAVEPGTGRRPMRPPGSDADPDPPGS